ncbi:MAG: CYTH domain-containing protein [Gammaproteobacteria bacterium]|nr:CYTH domain-containing protein [Gammaproteobacteria bacterium]
MATEIERKFLVRGDQWRGAAHDRVRYRQGYVAHSETCSVRVRIGGDAARLNIKSRGAGAARLEFEYPLPLADAEILLAQLCVDALIEKTRHLVRHQGRLWEVDVFEGANAGLVLAEVELDAADEAIALPPWVGDEVTDDARYYNAALAHTPYREW